MIEKTRVGKGKTGIKNHDGPVRERGRAIRREREKEIERKKWMRERKECQAGTRYRVPRHRGGLG